MINPIHKVLSTMQACQVRCLLMGGQACILYGGAEFSRDVDFVVLASDGNLARLRQALDELKAGVRNYWQPLRRELETLRHVKGRGVPENPTT